MSDLNADILVRYVRNADDTHGTEVIKFNDDDRPDLEIGKVGYVTTQELHLAASYGAVLEPCTAEEAEDLGLIVPEPKEDPEVISADLGQQRLDEIAAEEGVDLTGKRSNAAKAEAILEHRVKSQPVGQASLPATATILVQDGDLAAVGTTDSPGTAGPDEAAS